jgi:hypothetical protein
VVAARRPLTPAEGELIEKRYLEGATTTAIAGELGRSQSVIHRVVQKLGISWGHGQNAKYPQAPADKTCLHCGDQVPHRPPSHYARLGRGADSDAYCSQDCFPRAHQDRRRQHTLLGWIRRRI